MENGHMILVEIAPGIDLQRDILNRMDFRPRISPELKIMDPEIFHPVWGKLRAFIQASEGSRGDYFPMERVVAG